MAAFSRTKKPKHSTTQKNTENKDHKVQLNWLTDFQN